MALIMANIRSDVLDVDTSLTIISPCDYGKEYKKNFTLYLLHGAADNSLTWIRKTNIEEFANKYGATIIMPEGHKSYYTDMKNGMRYFSYISDELPKICNKMLGISTEAQNTFIAGLSMGGYGALKCALTKPHIYGKAVSLSGVVDIKERVSKIENIPAHRQGEFKGIFGESLDIIKENDLFYLANKLVSTTNKLPNILCTCGNEDMFVEMNRRFNKEMSSLPYEFSYIESNGGHNFQYWNSQLESMFDFLYE